MHTPPLPHNTISPFALTSIHKCIHTLTCIFLFTHANALTNFRLLLALSSVLMGHLLAFYSTIRIFSVHTIRCCDYLPILVLILPERDISIEFLMLDAHQTLPFTPPCSLPLSPISSSSVLPYSRHYYIARPLSDSAFFIFSGLLKPNEGCCFLLAMKWPDGVDSNASTSLFSSNQSHTYICDSCLRQ